MPDGSSSVGSPGTRRVRLGVALPTMVCVAVMTACSSDEGPATSDTTVIVDTTAAAPAGTTADTAETVATEADATTTTTDAVTTSSPPPTAATTSPTDAPADTGQVLVSFAQPDAIEGWSNVNDTVMGGVSNSTTTWQAGRLVFAGDLSLENNGGFTSVRGPADPTFGDRLAGATALVVEAEGDGKTYLVQLRTTDDTQYVARFTTVAGKPQTYRLPLDEFEAVTRFLDALPDAAPLDAGTVTQMTVYLLDKQTGTFRLAISSISAAA